MEDSWMIPINMIRQVGESELWKNQNNSSYSWRTYTFAIFWRTCTQQKSCLQMYCCLWNYFALKIYEFLVQLWLSVTCQLHYWSTACFVHCMFWYYPPLNRYDCDVPTVPVDILCFSSALSLASCQLHRKKTLSFFLIFHLLWFIFL